MSTNEGTERPTQIKPPIRAGVPFADHISRYLCAIRDQQYEAFGDAPVAYAEGLTFDEAKFRAAFICRAVNAHDALVEALEWAQADLQAVLDVRACELGLADSHRKPPLMRKIELALAQARGEHTS